MSLDHLSFATTPVVALREEQPLWQGSGFFYLFQEGGRRVLYLVTNFHVLSGHAPGTMGEFLADEIVFQFHVSTEELGDVRPIRIPLFTRQQRPVWLQSETVPEADLVAVPIPAHICESCVINCLDASWDDSGPAALSPTAPIHVVGFPYGYHDQANALPLWQRGALASEPAVDFGGQPMILIDLPAYPGMSGAPVFGLAYRGSTPDPQDYAQAGMVRHFLGIYASMPITEDGRFPEAFCEGGRPGVVARDASNWGRVWRARVIDELVSGIDTERWEREILADLA